MGKLIRETDERWGVCRGGVSYSLMASSDGCVTPDPCESILGEVSATCNDESQGSRGGDGLTHPVHQRRLNFIYTNSFCLFTSERCQAVPV